MKQILVAVTIAVIGTFVAGEAHAQTCVGTAPVDGNTPMQFGLGTSFTTGINQFGVGFAGGTERIVGGVDVGFNRYGSLDGTSVSFGAKLLTQVAADDTRRVVVCPLAQIGYESGPKDVLGTGLDLSGFTTLGGVAFGFVAYQSPAVNLVPAFEFSVGSLFAKASYFGESESVSDTFGLVSVAVGIVLERNGTIRPSVAFPLGLGDSEATFSIAYVFSF